LTIFRIRVRYGMRRYIFILPLLGALACNPFNQQAAEEEIKEIVTTEPERLNASEITLEMSIPAEDSIIVDSLFVLTGINLSTTFESESLAIYFNEEFKEDTFVVIGDSALVEITRKYKGKLDCNFIGREDGTEYANGRDFTSERLQYAQFADNKGWEIIGYSIAEERSDTNTTQIFSLAIKGDGLDTTIYSSAAIAPLDSFPELSAGANLSLELRTVADTSQLVCFALGQEAVRFTPKPEEEERWEAEVTAGEKFLAVVILLKKALANLDYPADLDLWIIPVTK
jgi:hypothetical protein